MAKSENILLDHYEVLVNSPAAWTSKYYWPRDR